MGLQSVVKNGQGHPKLGPVTCTLPSGVLTGNKNIIKLSKNTC
jgi:hypothetical protein